MYAPGISGYVIRLLKKRSLAEDLVQEVAQVVAEKFDEYDRDRSCAFQGIRRVSRPGRRVYVHHNQIPRVLSGLGTSILSTSQGLMTDTEARRRKVGGELVCEVW